MFRELEESLNRITNSQTVEELQPLLDQLGRAHGFSHSTYIDVRKVPLQGEPLPFFTTTVPEKFLESYLESGMVSFDPVVRRAATTNSPFLWTDCRPFSEGVRKRPGVKTSARRLMDLATDYRFQQGYVVPCHAVDSAGRPASAFVSFYWGGKAEDLQKSGALPPWLRLAVTVYHEKMLELRGLATNDNDPPPELSDREMECLVWSARGKTTVEVASILNITERTIEFHIGNVMQKLGVYNKVHAVAVAIQLGLISP